MPRASFRLAIGTAIYPQPLETPMTAHAEMLFGGSSIVVSRSRHATLPADRPCFSLDDVPHEPIWSPVSFYEHLQNWRSVKSVKAPVGAKKRALEHFFSEQAPDALLIEQGHEAKYFWLAAKRLGIPVFVYFRGIDATGYLRASRKQAGRIRSYKIMMRNIDGVFAVSQFLLDELAKHGIAHPVTHVIPSGVDTSLFVPARKRENHVLMVGRLIDKKAPEVAISAFISASEKVADAHLHVVGDGPLRRRCEAIVQHRGADAKVTFHGHLDHSAVVALMAHTPVFIQHSVSSTRNDKEGAPTSIQEAMASGMCIISTRHAGIPDLVDDGETGFLVAEHDVNGFTERLRQMLSVPQACIEVGRKGREVAERDFNKAMLHQRLEGLLLDHIKERVRRFR